MSETKGLEFKLDESTLRTMLGKTIIDAIPAEQKEGLLQAAVAHLLKPRERGEASWNKKLWPSPIEDIFNNAMEVVAGQEAGKFFREDPRAKEFMDKLLKDAWQKLTDGDKYEHLVNCVVSGMRSALAGERR